MLDWKVGDKVVCIQELSSNLTSHPRLSGVVFPQKGQILTIREIAAFSLGVGLRFQEMFNPPCLFNDGHDVEPAFYPKYFRPVKDTSLDQFRSLTKDPYGPVNDVGSQWDRTRKVKELT